jgi:carbon starvation protein
MPRSLKAIVLVGVSLLGAFACAVVTGIVNPNEKVNALWLLVAALCVYVIAYRLYASFLATKVFQLDDRRLTAAVRLNDGRDYHPTNKWVLFGHHFAAISGAGPILGPTLAAQFGYLPGFLWILVGSVLGGAVHDMVVLLASVRRDGKSLAAIARDELGAFSGIAVALAILFNVVVAVSGSAMAVVNALTASPWGTFTVMLTVPIAILMGVYLHYFRPGKVKEVSIIGAVLLLAAVFLGSLVPNSRLSPWFSLNKNELIFFLGVLCFFSSNLPVWLLLLPRDYVSSYLKIGTFLLLALGVVVIAPTLQMPPSTPFVHGGGPIVPGKVYPFLFITIACGSISGFHSIVSTGTTPKMVEKETDVPLLGYGAMLTESFVAVLCLIAATALLPGDYFSINATMPAQVLNALGFGTTTVGDISQAVGTNVAGRAGGSVSLAVGMTKLLAGIVGGRAAMPYWYNFCLMFQALFILTLVDAGTRVGRFLLQEIGGTLYRPLAGSKSQVYVTCTSLLIVGMWVYLIVGGSVSTIWPMFGVANQILAATVFGVGTSLLLKAGKVRYAWVTAVPMAFMTVTSLVAAAQLSDIFLSKAAVATNAAEALNYRVDVVFVALVSLLAVVILVDMGLKWRGYLAAKSPLGSTEVLQYAPSDESS